MSHPYKAAAHKQDPRWLKGLESLKEKSEFVDNDLKATLRPRLANPQVTALAAYASPKKGK